MKKIFAIMMSLLFVVSVFGVASVMAVCDDCHCDGKDFVFVPSEVAPGETFIIKIRTGCPYAILVEGGGNWNDYIVQTAILSPEGDMTVYQVKALKFGTLKFCYGGCCSGGCETLKITSRTLPMPSFMKILGFGQKD